MPRILPRLFTALCLSSCLVSTSAIAQSITAEEAALIDEGFRVFTEETFEGNGRTCGTCHVLETQYTIATATQEGPRTSACDWQAASENTVAR